jgi:multiple sugar transport system ATP-binding protein
VFVAQFIGSPPMNVLRGRMAEREVEVEGNRLPLAEANGHRPGDEVAVGVRAENVEVSHEQTSGALPAEVSVVEPLGSHLLLTLSLGGQALKASTRTDFAVKPRDRVWLRLDPASLRLLGAADY